MANDTDIFGKKGLTPAVAVTADKCTIRFDNDMILNEAEHISLQYAQPINRRRSIGNRRGIIWAGQPMGSLSIQRLFTTEPDRIFQSDVWKGCTGDSTITITVAGGCDDSTPTRTYTCRQCIASAYSLSLESEGLSVVDNIQIEFMQLQADDAG